MEKETENLLKSRNSYNNSVGFSSGLPGTDVKALKLDM